MRRSTTFWLLVGLALGVVNASADSSRKRMARFELYNNCQPVYLVVENVNEDAKRIGITRERVENSVELRLRSANLFTSDKSGDTYLYVNVNIVGASYSVSVSFNKWVYDPIAASPGPAITWHVALTGIYPRGTETILASVSRLVDKFLVEYLRVNEDACK